MVIPSALVSPLSNIHLPFDVLFPSLVLSVMTPRDKLDCSFISVWAKGENILTEKKYSGPYHTRYLTVSFT